MGGAGVATGNRGKNSRAGDLITNSVCYIERRIQINMHDISKVTNSVLYKQHY
jgi:hypothetical protein